MLIALELLSSATSSLKRVLDVTLVVVKLGGFVATAKRPLILETASLYVAVHPIVTV